ncbi:putative DNA topoisomerase II [Ceraceosorus guamensis]|uniref:DNA topoisomerase 2 n=1 Tax=Ceraceosorus guamensis TaxID=1522189 RepID=A0A316W4U2_9BASI|nr:putative DNA topoisomerase II [Ceraceosorus guamensis]PWN44138.1 putative DNA topoisomerase II [Ceraceosorus guamensis]
MSADEDSFVVPSKSGKSNGTSKAKPAAKPKSSTSASVSAPKAKFAAGAAAGTKKTSTATATKKAAPLKKRNSNEVQGEEFDPEGDESIFERPRQVASAGTGKSASEQYQKLSQLEHVLKRPDTYIGSVEKHEDDLWVYDGTTEGMAYSRKIAYVPGFYKIFDEILVNAADNKVRDPTMDTIKVTIDREEGSITVWNNGHGIPIEVHDKEGVYIPQLIFGELLTSSNYDDNEDKVTGGRNGYGAKLANIYSKEFVVETADKERELKYKQVFTDNMSKAGKPKITKNSGGKQEYTSITFKPDFERFKMSGIDADTESLLRKRVYDMAGTVKDCKVFLNGERLKVKSFKQYVEMYVKAINELSGEPKVDENGDEIANAPAKQTIIYDQQEDKGRLWEVAFAVSDGQFRHCSFVNHIATIKGGRHVDMVASQVESKIMEALKKNKKNGPVKSQQVRQQLWIFVNCEIVNPTFDGQTKETLTLKPSAFGSKYTVSDELVKKIMKAGVAENVLSFAKFQQEKQLKKTDGAKRSRITGILKLEDANNAGGRKARDCTLILTEGDSAKALAVSGLSEVGRDNYGVFPLRGKLLNVRDASHDMIMKNTEISHIKTILGLQHNKVYNSVDSLRYGKLMIMTDQDHDGSHIKGLIINFLDHFYPSLLKQAGFLIEFITPIVKCTKGKQEKSFFTIPEYERWKEENADGKGWVIKYYKGLGTSSSQDAKKYFRAMDKHMLPFDAMQDSDRALIDLAFNKKKADDRKEWLRQFRPGTYLDHNIDSVPLADFVNKELILFSMADNVRSIPSLVDGLKPGQRKVMFGCFKRKLKGEIKVAQLGGYVSEHSAYHHGEQSMYMTIVGLAQDFCGSNNINLLSPNGQFGTRLMGGKDAASARYIFTSLPSITRQIFHPTDDNLLNYLNDDGQSIEPEWYMPAVPLVLINGGEGIGTGWSSSLPNYNPKDIVANLRRRMAGEEYVPMLPWYRGFIGPIHQVGPDRFKCSGIIEPHDDGKTWEIKELPIRTWTSSYKEWLEERVVGTEKSPATIKEYKEYHTDTTVHFVIELNTRGQQEVKDQESAETYFKMHTLIATSNMVLFDQYGKIKKYATPEEILEDFYLLRLQYYHKRKEYLVEELKNAFERLSNQARFVQMIIKGELKVSNRKRNDIVSDLRRHDFRPFPKNAKGAVAAEVDDGTPEDEMENTGAESDYDYLLGMAIYTLTREKVERLLAQREEKEKELATLLGRSPENLWDEDLSKFSEEWQSLLDEDERRLKDVGSKKGKGAGAKRIKGGGASARKVFKDEDRSAVDSEDDYKPKVAAPKKRIASGSGGPAKSASGAAAAVVKRATSTLDDDDLNALTKASASASNGIKKAKVGNGNVPSAFKAAAAPSDVDDSLEADVIPTKASKSKTTSSAKARTASTSAKNAPATNSKKIFTSDEEESVVLTKAPPAPARNTNARARKAPVKYTISDSEAEEGVSEYDED